MCFHSSFSMDILKDSVLGFISSLTSSAGHTRAQILTQMEDLFTSWLKSPSNPIVLYSPLALSFFGDKINASLVIMPITTSDLGLRLLTLVIAHHIISDNNFIWVSMYSRYSLMLKVMCCVQKSLCTFILKNICMCWDFNSLKGAPLF